MGTADQVDEQAIRHCLSLQAGEQVRGMRLLPVFSPGRALLWGTILAAWGTGAIVASSSRALDIRTVCHGLVAVGKTGALQ